MTKLERRIVQIIAQTARGYGLSREFWSGYKRYRKSGDKPAYAAWCAAYDWDI